MSGEVLASIIGGVSTFLVSLVGLVRWAVTRIAKSHDDAATKSCAAQDRATDAIIKNTEITTKLVVKLDGIDTKIDAVHRSVKKRAQTSPGAPVMRLVPPDSE